MHRRRGLSLVFVVLVAALIQASSQQVPPAPLTEPPNVDIVIEVNATGLYHRRGCAWRAGQPSQTFSIADAKKRYFSPHCLCIIGRDGVAPCKGGAALGQ